MSNSQQKFKISWMLETAVIGLACNGKEMLIALLLHLQTLIDGVEFIPSSGVEVLLLMCKQLQVLTKHTHTSSISRF